jgi:predicted nucleic acid-binding protein
MKLVLDSNVAVKWALPEADTPQAVRFLNQFCRGMPEVLAPDIDPVEIAHALSRAERRGIISPPLGTRRLRAVLRHPPALHPYLPLLPRVFAISSAARHGVYDCLYVALAEREGCELVTADRKLISNLQARYPFIRDLATL